MKFSLADASHFSREWLDGWVYNKAVDYPDATSAYIELTGEHGEIRNAVNARCYLVMDGQWVFTIDKDQLDVATGDVIYIPKKTRYNFEATEWSTLKVFVHDTPAYNPLAEEERTPDEA